MRLAVALVCLPLAACPRPGGGGGGGGGGAPLGGGVGCPAASGVHVASYVTPDEGEQGYTGWVLPLHDRTVDTLDGVAEYAKLDAAAASAVGVPAPPPAVWLYGGAQPCKATIGSYYAAKVDSPTPNITYGVELAGCPAPPDPQSGSAIVVASEQPPTECQLVPPRGLAQRLGRVDDKGTWSKPVDNGTPIPPELTAVLPTKECTPPACEPLWSIARVELGGKPIAWAGALNWLAVPDPSSDPCTWKAERFSGFFVAGPDGAPVKVTEGQDHPLALTAVLADKTGPKVLVAEGPGEYSTYDLGGGAAKLGRHLVWLRPDPSSYEIVDHLGPICGE